MKTFPLDTNIKKLSRTFSDNGFTLYIVGGAVRDFLLHNTIKDFDFTTDATPEEVMKMFRRTIPTGIKHGTITIMMGDEGYEVTTFRSDADYSDGRHPDSVSFVRSLEEDLKRRDFTINALAADTKDGKIIDLQGGIQDLKTQTIRAIGESEKRFNEDGLRIMRACRFASVLGFHIEEETLQGMKKCKDNIKSVSFERIREELYKLLMGKKARFGLELLLSCGIMDYILPEISALEGVEQGGFHHEDVLLHTLSTVEAATKLEFSLSVRLAALLHDIGKKETQREDPSRATKIGEKAYSFHSHEKISEQKARIILKRLKDSNEHIDIVANLVRNHMFHYTPDWSDGAVRRFINKVGSENLSDLYDLRMCDMMAISGKASWTPLEELDTRVNNILRENSALTLKDLAIGGKDLIAIGVKPGPMIGQILNSLLEDVLDDPHQNNKETLTTIARAYLKTYSLT